jgi:hypothetical protein
MKNLIQSLLLIIFVCCATAAAQTTTITYQGRLNDGANPANGVYEMNFTLFDALTGGNQIGATLTNTSIQVNNGVFTAPLNFTAANAFDGSERFIQITVKKPAETNATVMTPRQRVTPAPYAVRALKAGTANTADNSLALGGIAASQYVSEGDTRLTDARNPLPGSTKYIQNSTAMQAASNFNISGTASANLFNAVTQFNLSGERFLSVAGTKNLFVGRGTGAANTTGTDNTFVGENAGSHNTVGIANSFFGANAGSATTTGQTNSIFGMNAGMSNTTGSGNSFFGASAGGMTTGNENSFFGERAGEVNTTGERNVFVGAQAGGGNVTGSNNVFIGGEAGVNTISGEGNVFVGNESGSVNTNGSYNTLIGFGANVESAGLTHATAIGAHALVYTSNTIALGRPSGDDKVVIYGLAGGGQTQLCRTAGNEIATCSSSLRYKTNINAFTPGMSFVRRLRPISFDWIEGGMKDVGFGAEDVAKIDPTFVIYNKAGQVEGLKYDRLSVVFVNAFKEQQVQIEAKQKVIDEQGAMIEALKKIVCSAPTEAEVCQK